MAGFEYRVIPAPTRGQKVKGTKTADARFAHAIEAQLNEMAADGWQFHRAETLPSVERSGLTSTTTTYRSVLVFQRPVAGAAAEPAPTQPTTQPTTPPDDAPIGAADGANEHS